jgi:hypothetical protein
MAEHSSTASVCCCAVLLLGTAGDLELYAHYTYIKHLQ